MPSSLPSTRRLTLIPAGDEREARPAHRQVRDGAWPGAAGSRRRGGGERGEFMSENAVLFALICASLAVIYGALLIRVAAGAAGRRRQDAGGRRRRPGGREGVPQPPVQDDRHGRRGRLRRPPRRARPREGLDLRLARRRRASWSARASPPRRATSA